MPFDAAPAVQIPDLSKPSLEALAWLLRHPDRWPEGFAERGWDYRFCITCAIGLASQMWGVSKTSVHDIAANFKISLSEAQLIFTEADYVFQIEMEEIQPEHVAGIIGRVIANRAVAP